MKNVAAWRETKYHRTPDGLVASRDPNQVSPGSRLMVDLQARAYLEALEAHASGRLLDLGCGAVPLYSAYAARVAEAVCVDWPGSMHDVTRHVDHFVDLSAEKLPFPDGTFDTVLATDVLEHIPVPEQVWAEMARVMKPGGRCIVGVPFLYWIHEEPHDYFRFTQYALQRSCAAVGLVSVDVQAIGGAPEVVLDVLGKALADRPRRFAFVERVGRRLLRTPGARRLSAATREHSPLAYCFVARKPDHGDVLADRTVIA